MRKLALTVLLATILVACSTPQVRAPAPTPQAIFVAVPPSLKPWGDKLSACAVANPLVAVYSKQVSPSDTQLTSDEIVFSFGEPDQAYPSAGMTQVGSEKIVVVVNQANGLAKLSINQLEAILSGQTTRWENNPGHRIQVWVYPPGDPMRETFDQALGSPNRLAPDAMLAPDLQAMLEAVAGDEGAIGYLTQNFLSEADPSLADRVKILPVDPSLAAELSQPIIAITQNEPGGLVRELLACLQAATP